MIEQLKTIREALEEAHDESLDSNHFECRQYLLAQITALTQLEAMVGEQEPQRCDDCGDTVPKRKCYCRAGCVHEAAPVAQQPQEIEVQCPVCNHKFYEWPNDKQPQAEAVLVVDRVYEAAKRLVDHADFQLGGVLSAKSKARDIPSNAASKVKARHLASLRDALAKAPQQAEAVQPDVARDAERYQWLRLALADRTNNGKSHWFCSIAAGHPEELDEAIDAAIAQHKGQQP